MDKKTLAKRILRILPDPLYLRLRYLIAFREPLHLKNPRTFNEKLQWLKLHDRNPEYTRMVDKYEAKKICGGADRGRIHHSNPGSLGSV